MEFCCWSCFTSCFFVWQSHLAASASVAMARWSCVGSDTSLLLKRNKINLYSLSTLKTFLRQQSQARKLLFHEIVNSIPGKQSPEEWVFHAWTNSRHSKKRAVRFAYISTRSTFTPQGSVASSSESCWIRNAKDERRILMKTNFQTKQFSLPSCAK